MRDHQGMPFTLARHPYPVVARPVQLAARTELAPGFLRLRLQERTSGALEGFLAPGPGDHFRVVVDGLDADGLIPVGPDNRPLVPSSTYTAVAWELDAEPRWVEMDVVLHDDDAGRAGGSGAGGGDAGAQLAGARQHIRAGVARWSAIAPIGAPAVITGPKGSVLMTGRPDRVLLAGDDTAVPALRRYLGMLGPNARGDLLLETDHDPAVLELEVPAGIAVSILSPQPGAPSASIVAALRDRPRPSADPADVFVFICAEQSVVSPARALLARWGIPVDSAVVKGYWKR